MLLYYISDRTQFPGDETTRRKTLLNKFREAASAGVDYIQLREKDLAARDLESLAREAVEAVQNSSTKLLINSRGDIALACGAHGVHLRSDDISVADARSIAATKPGWLVAASCHSVADVAGAKTADFVVFAPVFEKGDAMPTGIDSLREACSYGVPVLALGGVTLSNAKACLDAGAAGVAGIRLFQQNNISEVVRRLRS